MPIRKQEFYEGAALHMLTRTGDISSLRYEAPVFIINEELHVLIKYTTKGRSPWGFTFAPAEYDLLRNTCGMVVMALVCGSDGVAAITLAEIEDIVDVPSAPVRISCFRDHGQHYELRGPSGRLGRKVAPSRWQNILRSAGDL